MLRMHRLPTRRKRSGDQQLSHPFATTVARAAVVTTSSSSSSLPQPRTTNVKYPTARGSEVDARKIVATGAGRQHLTAVRVQHILFRTPELAEESLHRLLLKPGTTTTAAVAAHGAALSFGELARLVSACEETRERGGAVGWMQVREEDDDALENYPGEIDSTSSAPRIGNQHLDGILPLGARRQIVQISTKPGDIFRVESSRGHHLVQIVDVMADVRRMATQLPRRKRPGAAGVQEEMTAAPLRGGTYLMETMGCQMNSADAERMEGQLQGLGLRPHDPASRTKADVVVLNTCSIREHAEQKVYSYLGPHAKRKREGEDVVIVVAGCVAQQEGRALLRRVPEVDLVLGPQYANRLGDLLEDVANGNQVVATEASHIMEDSTKPRRSSTTVAWVNVIYGCNERCTFCIVPTTRGTYRCALTERLRHWTLSKYLTIAMM